VLSSPLGTTLATLEWADGTAVLNARGTTQPFDSLQSLSRQALVEIPIAALFEWLQGLPSSAPGWTVDLDQFDAGRVRATRLGPDMHAEITVLLDR